MFRCYCDVNVVVVVVDDVFVVYVGVYYWEGFEGFGGCVYEQVYEVEFDVVFFYELVLVFFMQFYGGLYVYFVEGGEQCCCVLYFFEVFGDVGVDVCYWYVFFGMGVVGQYNC